MARRNAPEVNAGSMADIAFLLLIFFLVTTTIETDSGISRKLPPIDDTEQEDVVLKERNIFEVLVDDAGNISFKAQYKESESDSDFITLQNFSLDRSDFTVSVNPSGRIYFSNLGALTDRVNRAITVSGDNTSFIFCVSSLGAVYQLPPLGNCDG